MGEAGRIWRSNLHIHARDQAEAFKVVSGAAVAQLDEHLRDGVERLREPTEGG